MAISGTHYRLLKSIQPILPQGGTLLEIGEANWYGDLDPSVMYDDIIEARPTDVLSDKTLRLTEAIRSRKLHEIAKACYQVLFAPSRIVSIDMNGTPAALRQDLNGEIDLGNWIWCCGSLREGLVCPCCHKEGRNCSLGFDFDIAINHGTAEHVFNIAQVFKTMHDLTCTDGLMIHESPFTGWIDHGVYGLQPTLFYDLAAANGYEIVLVAIEQIESGTIIRLEGRD